MNTISIDDDQSPKQQDHHQIKVAVIGCGPGGISFLHAVETRRRKLIKEGDVDGLAKLPIVTVFERNSLPGGVWRSNNNCKHTVRGQDEMQKEENEAKDITEEANEENMVSLQTMKQNKEAGVTPVGTFDITPIGSDSGNEAGYSSESSDSSNKEEGEEELQDDTTKHDQKFLGKEKKDENENDRSDEESDEEDDYIIERRTSSSTNMYEALWTNGPCQGIEFPDYTFMDHFGKDLPVYLPRCVVLEYILARVTRNCQTFFDAVKFNTSVELVNCIEAEGIGKMEIITYDEIKKERNVELFDKCIWAAGCNGFAKIPKSIRSILHQGKFLGLDVHSSQAAKHLDDLKGKKIVMIGDGLSAEDLALQAIKLGIDEIYIIARSGNGICSYTSAWPENRVKVIHEMVLTAVIDDGKGLRFAKMQYDPLKEKCAVTDYDDVLDIFDVSGVIYCTGYETNDGMIGTSIYDEEKEEDFFINDLPKDWKMETNRLTEILGEVKPSDILITDNDYLSVSNSEFNGICITNPNMMYLFEGTANFPLQEIDVRAWYFLAIIMGDINLPSAAEMIEKNHKLVQKSMQIPLIRSEIDMAYQEALKEASAMEGNEWLDDPYSDERYIQMEEESSRFVISRLGEEMNAASYPCQLLGPNGDLNEKGNLLLQMTLKSDFSRTVQEENGRKTFRDFEPSWFKSLYTGQQARRLKALWLDIDDKDIEMLAETD